MARRNRHDAGGGSSAGVPTSPPLTEKQAIHYAGAGARAALLVGALAGTPTSDAAPKPPKQKPGTCQLHQTFNSAGAVVGEYVTVLGRDKKDLAISSGPLEPYGLVNQGLSKIWPSLFPKGTHIASLPSGNSYDSHVVINRDTHYCYTTRTGNTPLIPAVPSPAPVTP